jgi:hypothetical protein
VASQNGDAKAAQEAYEASVRSAGRVGADQKINVRSVFRDHGLVTLVEDSKNGVMERADFDSIRERLIGDVLPETVVKTKDDRTALPTTPNKLAAVLFHKMPSPDDEDAWNGLSAEEREAWLGARGEAWKCFGDDPDSTFWQRVAEEFPELMLVKTKDEAYLTAEVKFITKDSINPRTDAITLSARKMGDRFGLYAAQVPALERTVRSQTKKALAAAGDLADSAIRSHTARTGGSE